MHFRWDKKYLHWGVTAFCVIAASIIFFLFLSKLDSIWYTCGIIFRVIKPVLYGLVFAYLMNPLMKKLERPKFYQWGLKLFGSNERKARSFSRMLAIFLTLLLVFVLLFGLLAMVIPRVYESIELLFISMPAYINRGRFLVEQLFHNNPQIEEFALGFFDNISRALNQFMNGDVASELKDLVIQISSGVYTVIRGVLDIAVGFIVAVYVLVSKERFSAQMKKLIYSVFDLQKATEILDNCHEANRIFIGFVSGKILDSIIIGIICYFALALMQMPYQELVSVIIGVTNIIPFFGPFIGAIPSAFLILLINPMKCLTFIIFILVLQQFDGNILGPKILGNNTGLSSFWVICAILVGGGLFGFVGMLVGVPVFAILYTNAKRWVEGSLRKKGITASTTEFRRISHIDPITGDPVYMESDEEKKNKA